jgi:uridine kinase
VGAIRSSVPPAGVTTRIVAIDGPGGAGKSSLAAYLARELDAPVVHTDEFASWQNPVDWWPELIEKVLEPLAAGRAARYTPSSWGGPEREQVVVEPGDFVLLEGVTASRDAFRPYLAYSIWIETPRDVRLRRGLDREGEDARADWKRWMAGEDAYVERERPPEHADVVLRGDDDLWV